MSQNSPNQSTPQCPPEEIWYDVAAGLVSLAEERHLLGHASTCDFCGPLLRDASVICADGSTPEEEAFLADVGSPSIPAPDSKLKKVISIGSKKSTPAAKDSFESPGRKLWLAIAAMGLLFIGASGWHLYERANSPRVLLAKAYTARRTMEVRFAGAEYSTMRTERGSAISGMDRPIELMKAEPKIRQGLESAPYDLRLLQAKAQAELLEWQFNPAISNLTRALQLNQNDVPLLIDLASANFQKGEAEQAAQFYGQALEWIMKATTLQPQSSVAWFNRAMIQERLFLHRESIKSFEQFLTLESSGGWAQEARQHLDYLKKK